MGLPDLHLNLKGEYFDQIKAGEKPEEFRLCNDYWKKRLEGKRYGNIFIKRGYPKASDTERIIVRTYVGWTKKIITHAHFGPAPVQVYAINVTGHGPF